LGDRPAYGGFARFSDSFTLPLWLDGVGYERMLAGKYLNGYTSTYVPPGWDRWFGYTGNPSAYYDYG